MTKGRPTASINVLGQVGHLLEVLGPGEARFFSCPEDRCSAAVAGKCANCNGLWAWCGCGANTFHCPCGLNEELNSPEARARLANARVKALEASIREHKERVWGDAEVTEAADMALYSALDEE